MSNLITGYSFLCPVFVLSDAADAHTFFSSVLTAAPTRAGNKGIYGDRRYHTATMLALKEQFGLFGLGRDLLQHSFHSRKHSVRQSAGICGTYENAAHTVDALAAIRL